MIILQILSNTFVLLLHIPDQSRYFIELRSLKNLLKSVNYEIPGNFFSPDDETHLFSSHHFVALHSRSRVIVLDIENLENFQLFPNFQDVVSLLVLQGSLYYINSCGVIARISEDNTRLLESSPLLKPIVSCCVIDDRIHVASRHSISNFSPNSPLDYESYETEHVLTRGLVKKFGEQRLMVFDRTSQTCFVWEIGRPKSPSHLLRFGSSEYTVDVACDAENLYSLTAAGVISVWKLRPNGNSCCSPPPKCTLSCSAPPSRQNKRGARWRMTLIYHSYLLSGSQELQKDENWGCDFLINQSV